MKTDEIKARVHRYVDDLIDKILNNGNALDGLKVTAAKYWLKRNIWKLDGILCSVADKEGEIDVTEAMNHFESALFDSEGKFKLEVRSIIPDGIKDFIPDKVVVFTRDDIRGILGCS